MRAILGVLLWTLISVECVLYDRYSGKKLDEKQTKEYEVKNLTSACAIDVSPCTPHEGSRVDGTCSSIAHPTRGSAFTPFLRLLPPDYANNRDIRVAKDGEALPLARKVRTSLLHDGRVVSRNFNVAGLHYVGFVASDVSAVVGILDYLRVRTYCCEPQGAADPRCLPILVPEDDPYLKVTGVRCLNFTRAQTFQDSKCVPDTIPPEQINFQTPLLDLSNVYGVDESSLAAVREPKGGLLKMEVRGGRYLPLGDVGNDVCIGNLPNETICYRFGNAPVGNFDLRLATINIFFFREHNRIAKALAEINPCWSDDRLFKVTRQITIATAANLYLYELLPLFLGYKNMVEYGIISARVEFLKEYEDQSEPNIYAEYIIATRYFHTFIDGRIKKYDKHYRATNELSISDTLFRSALIEEGQNFEEINRGTFYQKASAFDDIVDPEISETFYSKFQRASDLLSIDIQRGRDLGLRGYNQYRKLCGFPEAKVFDDFLDTIEISKVDALKLLYKDVDDVDLYAGIVSETYVEGAFVGPTLFCIMAKQLVLLRTSDRFWFERGDNMHSFDLPQLYEIRKTTMARFACDNVDGIKFMQPQAFLNIGKGNEPVDCEHIPGIELRKWEDASCHKDSHTLFRF